MKNRVHCHSCDPEAPCSLDPVADLCRTKLVGVSLMDQLPFLLPSERRVFFAKDAHCAVVKGCGAG